MGASWSCHVKIASQETILWVPFGSNINKVSDLGNWQTEKVWIWTPVEKWPLLRIGLYFVCSSFLLLKIDLMDDSLVICSRRTLGVMKCIKVEMKNNIEITSGIHPFLWRKILFSRVCFLSCHFREVLHLKFNPTL